MIFVSILIFVIINFLYYYFTRTFNVWRNKNVAGPKPIPFFGNLKESILRRKNIGIVYKEIYDQYPNESVIGIYRMTSPTLIIRDLDIVKQILIKDFDVFSERGMEFSKEGLGDNLFHCDKTTWQAIRGLLTSVFTPKKLKNTYHLLNHHADQLVNFLDTATSVEPEQELFRSFRKYTMATTMAVSFSISIDFFNENHEEIERAGELIFTSTYAAEFDMLFPNILKKLNKSLYPYLVNKFCYDVVHTKNNQKNSVPMTSSVLDILLTLKKKKDMEGVDRADNIKQANVELTEHLIAAQVFIFFAAGFGNNHLSMPYALFRLAKNQVVQDKLIKEIDDVLKKYDGQLTYDALKDMNYLEKVFDEVLRMNSLAHAVPRTTNKNYNIPGTDVVIEKGTAIIISPYAIHRDGRFYPDPDIFDPERFSPENSASRHPCAYIPFGAGPRSCLGKQMAKLQFFAGIVNILRKFRVEPSEKTKMIEEYEPMSTLLATKGGVYVKFIKRKK